MRRGELGGFVWVVGESVVSLVCCNVEREGFDGSGEDGKDGVGGELVEQEELSNDFKAATADWKPAL